MENLTNVDMIMSWLSEKIQSQQPIDGHTWAEAAQSLNVLVQNEQDKLFELEQSVAKLRNALILEGNTVAYAKSMIEATDEYKNVKKQKAKVDRVIELIKLCKVHARMSNDIMRGQ